MQPSLFDAPPVPPDLCPHGFHVEDWWEQGTPDQFPTPGAERPRCRTCGDRAWTRFLARYLLAAASGSLRQTRKHPGMAVSAAQREAVNAWLRPLRLTYADAAERLDDEQAREIVALALDVPEETR